MSPAFKEATIMTLSLHLGALLEKRETHLRDLRVANLQAALFVLLAVANIIGSDLGGAILTAVLGMVFLYVGGLYLKRAKRTSRLIGKGRSLLAKRLAS